MTTGDQIVFSIIGTAVGIFIVVMIIGHVKEKKKIAAMPLPERQKYLAEKEVLIRDSQLTYRYGKINPVLICPHCQEKGNVRTKHVTQKKGVSGGKAAAAVLTGGISVLATGLSRKGQATEAYCGNCESKWEF